MDIVYVYKEPDNFDASELRYSLRSLKNIDHDKVFIIGDKPAWVTNVEYISTTQNDTKNENVARNMTVAINTAAISEDFIMMNDDFFVMKPQGSMGTLHWGLLQDIITKYSLRYAQDTEYTRVMKQNYELLTSLGFTKPLCYELHVPIVLNKKNMRKLQRQLKAPSYQYRTVYGNCFDIGGTQMEDVKVFLDPLQNDPDYEKDPAVYLAAQSFLSATGGSFARGLVGTYVRQQFPEKSVYEV